MSAAEQVVRNPALDWTIVRAPELTDNPAKGSYRTAVERNVLFGVRVTGDESAARPLDTAGDESAIRKHVNVAN
ncbi:NAD(P)H-binding protein [Nocardia beijingensis]|nr:NAD(P)H-binding protein [Nocardia beijingensis]